MGRKEFLFDGSEVTEDPRKEGWRNVEDFVHLVIDSLVELKLDDRHIVPPGFGAVYQMVQGIISVEEKKRTLTIRRYLGGDGHHRNYYEPNEHASILRKTVQRLLLKLNPATAEFHSKPFTRPTDDGSVEIYFDKIEISGTDLRALNQKWLERVVESCNLKAISYTGDTVQGL